MSELSTTSILAIFLGFVVLIFGVVYITKWVRFSFFERKMVQKYEAFDLAEKSAAFPKGKEEFCFVGSLLCQILPKKNMEELFAQYTDLYKMYTSTGENVYGTFCYAKEQYQNLSDDDIYSVLAVIMLNADGASQYGDCSVERLAPFKRKAEAQVKAVKTIASHPEIFDAKDGKPLGSREHAILVTGKKGLEDYLNTLATEDGTEFYYVQKGTLHITDKELDIKYDLRKYALRDASTDGEMRNLWFNVYGAKNCEECIDWFTFKKEDLEQKTVDADAVALKAPTNVKVNNDPSTGRPKVTWNAVEGADKYFVYKSLEKNSPYTYYGFSTEAEFEDTCAEVNGFYYYKIIAVDTTNKFAKSKLSEMCYIICDLPCPVVTAGTDEETGCVKLTWDEVDGATKYEIYRAKSEDGEFKRMNTQRGTTYVNTGLVERGVTYYYKVKAVHNNVYANSALSEVVSGSAKLSE